VSGFPELMHTALDATDVRGLAEFYRVLLGVRYRPGDEPPADGSADGEDWLVLVDADGSRVLAFQEVPTLDRPTAFLRFLAIHGGLRLLDAATSVRSPATQGAAATMPTPGAGAGGPESRGPR